VKLPAVDLWTDTDDGSTWIESVGEQLEDGSSPLEDVEEVLARLELRPARITEQAGRTADV
jgi:hypothetical protein